MTVQGDARDGGTIAFKADDVKQNHPTKPLDTAQVIYNSLEPTSAAYEAILRLEFGAGRDGLGDALATLADRAPDGVEPTAWFLPPGDGAK